AAACAAVTARYGGAVWDIQVVCHGRVERRRVKKQFAATTPRDFVLEWDAEVNGSPGFAQLQGRRESFMASRLREISRGGGPVLAVIEVERVRGVLTALRG